MEVLQNIPGTHLGFTRESQYGHKLRITHIPQDRAAFIRSGARLGLAPDMPFVTLCDAIHLKRKFADGSHRTLKCSDNAKIIRGHLEVLGLAQTHAMFINMCSYMMKFWRDVLHEEE
ncbi:MAG: hypothetical protein ACREBR_01175 [bacterium]